LTGSHFKPMGSNNLDPRVEILVDTSRRGVDLVSSSDTEIKFKIPNDVVAGQARFRVRTTIVVNQADCGVVSTAAKNFTSNEVSLNTRTNYVFAALARDDQIAVMDDELITAYPQTPLLARINVGKDSVFDEPRSIAITTDRTRAYVALRGSGQI